jgi:hypothetical protein
MTFNLSIVTPGLPHLPTKKEDEYLAKKKLKTDSFSSYSSIPTDTSIKSGSEELIEEFCKDSAASAIYRMVEKTLKTPVKIIFSNSKKDSVFESGAVEAWSDMVTKEVVIRDTLPFAKKKIALLWELLNLFFSQKNESFILEKRKIMSPDQWACFCMKTEFKTAIHFDMILQKIIGWKDLTNKKDHLYNYKSMQDFFSSQIEMGAFSNYVKEQERFLKEEAEMTDIPQKIPLLPSEGFSLRKQPIQKDALLAFYESFSSKGIQPSEDSQKVASLSPDGSSSSKRKGKRKEMCS